MSYEITYTDDKLLKPLTKIEQEIVSMYSEGISVKDIAIELGVNTPVVKRILNKPEVRQITNDLIMNYGNTLKAEKLRLLGSIVDDKLKEMEEQVDEDGNKTGRLADITNKDIVDLLQIMDSMQKEEEKAKLGTNTNNTYIQLLNNIME